MVLGAHFHFTVEALELQAFHRIRHFHRIGGLGLGHGSGQHRIGVVDRAGVPVVVETLLVFVGQRCIDATHVVVGVAHEEDTPISALAQRGRGAAKVGVIGIEVGLQASIVGSLDQQCQVGTPVTGDDRVSARCLDLGHIGSEVTHLSQRVQVVTDDLDVRALALQGCLGKLRHLLAMGIVLVDQVDLLDLRTLLDVGGHGLHLHRGICVQTEVPERALAVGQIRVDRRVVQEHDLLAGVAFIVLVDGVDQRQRRTRTQALHDVTGALVNGRLQGVEAFSGRQLVVDADHFKLDASRVVGVELLGKELVRAQLVLANVGHQAGQGIDPRDLHGFALLGKCSTGAQGSAHKHTQGTTLKVH